MTFFGVDRYSNEKCDYFYMDVIRFCPVVPACMCQVSHYLLKTSLRLSPPRPCQGRECEDTVQRASSYLSRPLPPRSHRTASWQVADTYFTCMTRAHLLQGKPATGPFTRPSLHLLVRLMFSGDKILHCALRRFSCLFVFWFLTHTRTQARA